MADVEIVRARTVYTLARLYKVISGNSNSGMPKLARVSFVIYRMRR